ncbi:MAG: GGDEF domain-containing protein [Pyrinomonadaceae bacterium]|nr:GGDEF domain-containing protein [Pyrinomonadaceae bacterium]
MRRAPSGQLLSIWLPLAVPAIAMPGAPYWNAFIRLNVLLLFTYLLTLLKQAFEAEKQLARTDHLTRVANRRFFYELTEMELDRAHRYNHPLTVAYIDIDNFKTVNDRLGHDAGDQLLFTMAEAIKKSIRSVDRVARLGGDDFAILLPETGHEQSQVVVSKIKDMLARIAQERRWDVTFSIGVITCLKPPCAVEDLTKMADKLMYAAKNDGKNSVRYELFDEQQAMV